MHIIKLSFVRFIYCDPCVLMIYIDTEGEHKLKKEEGKR